MNKEDDRYDFLDNGSCLEWLKNQRYPDGIKCSVCNKFTKYHKLPNSRCFSCDNCGNRVYPTSGTIFHKSTTPLKTWFKVINRISSSRDNISVKTIQREYGMTYKTAWRMVHKIRNNLKNNQTAFPFEDISDKADIDKISVNNPFKRTKEKVISNFNDLLPRTEKSSFADKLLTATLQKQENQRAYYRKQDRTARLLNLQILLWQNPQGLTIDDLSKRCVTSRRTVYRDLHAVETELNVPIWEEGKKRGIIEGHFLPPITFSVKEAFNIFIASRLLEKQYHFYNPSLTSTFMKIHSNIQPHLKKIIQDSMEYKENLQGQEYKIENLYTLAQAWLSQHRVKINYQEDFSSEATEFIIEPYFIEPSIYWHSIFVIAYCPVNKHLFAFNVNQIIGDVIICPETYEIPTDFRPIESINSAWGMPSDGELTTIKLRFKPVISRTVMSTIWHPSQKLELQSDNSVIATFKVRERSAFHTWVLSWGDNVEILEPKLFRDKIVDFAKALLLIYAADGAL